MTLKEKIYKILVEKPETRNSRSLLKWEVLKDKGFVKSYIDRDELVMSKEDFIKWETDTVRRCSQNLQRSDLLTGAKLIQPTKEIKQKRVKLSQEKGASFIMGKDEVKEEWVFNPETGEYRHEM